MSVSRKAQAMSEYKTVFGSLDRFEKGGVDVIDDNPKNYVFSNLFEVASRAKPYERIAVAKNFEYVIEAARAQGTSPWYAAAHDEFAVCMDGRVVVVLVKLDDPAAGAPAKSQGAHVLRADPVGRKMGRIVLGRGHMALLPAQAAYRFEAAEAAAIMIQTIQGPVTIEKWREICLA